MYLGLDLGTSELKALLLSDTHQVVATARVALQVQRPQPLWAEQQPADWWRAVEAVMAQWAQEHPAALRAVRAIGLSGQMHGAVLLDGDLEVLRPAILWNDGRSHHECDELTEKFPQLLDITGNLFMPGFTAPKLLWLQRHEPEIFKRIAKVMLPKDYLRLRLTGQVATDCSDASGTLFLDVGRRRWLPAALEVCGLSLTHMPELLEGSDASGEVLPHWVQRFGLSPGVKVAAGGGDNAVSAVGLGITEPGQGFVSLGTSGVVFAATDQFRPQPAQAVHAFCHALPGRWHEMSVMLSAAASVTWARQVLGLPSEAALVDSALRLSMPDRARAPQFLPYLSGERTPHNDTRLTASWAGLRSEHGADDLAYAVVEGVCFGLLDGLQTLSVHEHIQRVGGSLSLSVIGGGSRSAGWVQWLACALNATLVTHEGSDACAALGAARLAWLADGGVLNEVCASLPVIQQTAPDSASVALLSERYAIFRTLGPQKRPLPRT